jgi:CubicO group peptidase (beta-lactamase class C family)
MRRGDKGQPEPPGAAIALGPGSAPGQQAGHPPPGGPFDGYGYQWWVTSDHGHPSFLAVGYGGQFVQVIPDLDLVVVITSDAESGRDDA